MKFQIFMSQNQVLVEPRMLNYVLCMTLSMLCCPHRDPVAGKSSNVYSQALESDLLLSRKCWLPSQIEGTLWERLQVRKSMVYMESCPLWVVWSGHGGEEERGGNEARATSWRGQGFHLDSALHGMGRKLWNQEDVVMRTKVQVGTGASQSWNRLRLAPKGGRRVQKAGKRSQEGWRKPTH